MSVLDDLRGLSAAEDFFAYLEVPFDPAVVNVVRLHVLRRMGEYLRDSALAEGDDEVTRRLCRAFLAKAYADFLASSPMEQRVFKVHRDAVAPAALGATPFVPLATLTAGRVLSRS